MSQANLKKGRETQRLNKDLSKNLDDKKTRHIMESVRNMWPSDRSETDLMNLIQELKWDVIEINNRINLIWEEHQSLNQWKDVSSKKNTKKEVSQKQTNKGSKQRQTTDHRNRGQYENNFNENRSQKKYNPETSESTSFNRKPRIFQEAMTKGTEQPQVSSQLNQTQQYEENPIPVSSETYVSVSSYPTLTPKETNPMNLVMGATRSDNLGPTSSVWGKVNPAVYTPVQKEQIKYSMNDDTNNNNINDNEQNEVKKTKKKKSSIEDFPSLLPSVISSFDQKQEQQLTSSSNVWGINQPIKNKTDDFPPINETQTEKLITQEQFESQIAKSTEINDKKKSNLDEKSNKQGATKSLTEANLKNKKLKHKSSKNANYQPIEKEIVTVIETVTTSHIETEKGEEFHVQEFYEEIEINNVPIENNEAQKDPESSPQGQILSYSLEENNESDVNIILNVSSQNNNNYINSINNNDNTISSLPSILIVNSNIEPEEEEIINLEIRSFTENSTSHGPVNFGRWEDDISDNGDICFGFSGVCLDDVQEFEQQNNNLQINESLSNQNITSWNEITSQQQQPIEQSNAHFINDNKPSTSLYTQSEIASPSLSTTNTTTPTTNNASTIVTTTTTPPPPGFDQIPRSTLPNQIRSDLPPGLDSPNHNDNINHNNNNQTRTNFNLPQEVLTNQIHPLVHGQHQHQENIRNNMDPKQDKKYNERNTNNHDHNSHDNNNLRQKNVNSHPMNQHQYPNHPMTATPNPNLTNQQQQQLMFQAFDPQFLSHPYLYPSHPSFPPYLVQQPHYPRQPNTFQNRNYPMNFQGYSNMENYGAPPPAPSHFGNEVYSSTTTSSQPNVDPKQNNNPSNHQHPNIPTQTPNFQNPSTNSFPYGSMLPNIPGYYNNRDEAPSWHQPFNQHQNWNNYQNPHPIQTTYQQNPRPAPSSSTPSSTQPYRNYSQNWSR